MIGNFKDSDSNRVEEKVTYIGKQHPSFIRKCDIDGFTPLHFALSLYFDGVIALYGMNMQVIRDQLICTDTENSHHTSLPLHMFFKMQSYHHYSYSSAPVSIFSDCLRLFVKNCPEAAGIKDGNGFSPYDFARALGVHPYIQRLLLRSDPTIDPIELHNLNYERRRMAMFVCFTAVVASTELKIFCRLRVEDKNLLRYVISFL